jgi:hypothetical protein
VSHPPYLPDISLSDFYLFGRMKSALIGYEIPDKIRLLDTVTGILSNILNDELHVVFRNWIKHIQNLIDGRWGHVSS